MTELKQLRDFAEQVNGVRPTERSLKGVVNNLIKNYQGGGTTVVANPELAGTEDDLTGLQVGETKYKVPQGGGNGQGLPEGFTVALEVKQKIANQEGKRLDFSLLKQFLIARNVDLTTSINGSFVIAIGAKGSLDDDYAFVDSNSIKIGVISGEIYINFESTNISMEENSTLEAILDALIQANYYADWNTMGISLPSGDIYTGDLLYNAMNFNSQLPYASDIQLDYEGAITYNLDDLVACVVEAQI